MRYHDGIIWSLQEDIVDTVLVCAASEDGCMVNTHDRVPTDGFAVFGVAKDSQHSMNQIEIYCPIADPESAPQSFSCNFCGLNVPDQYGVYPAFGSPAFISGARMNGAQVGAQVLGVGETCKTKQDLFNENGGSYGGLSCSAAQQQYGSTCCEATCDLCAAGTSLKNGSAIGGHYSDGTLYTCAAARERLYSFTAASAECDVASITGQYQVALAVPG